jgi:hypothetical protein
MENFQMLSYFSDLRGPNPTKMMFDWKLMPARLEIQRNFSSKQVKTKKKEEKEKGQAYFLLYFLPFCCLSLN